MELDARVSVLMHVPLYQGLADAELAEIAAEARSIPLAKGDTLFEQGEEALHGYIMAWGRVRLDQNTADGQNMVVRYIGPGEMLGTVAVFRRIPYPATSVAVEDSMALAWSALRLNEQIRQYSVVGLNAVQVVGGRVEELMARLQEIATQRVERRIAAALLRLANQTGRRIDTGVEIPFQISRQDLAEMTATTLHTVSRTLSAWSSEGILDARRRGRLVICRPHRLVQIAEEA